MKNCWGKTRFNISAIRPTRWNKSVEKGNRTIIEAARTMIHAKDMQLQTWNSGLRQWLQLCLFSIVGISNVAVKTPYKLWYAKVPRIYYLRSFETAKHIFTYQKNKSRNLLQKVRNVSLLWRKREKLSLLESREKLHRNCASSTSLISAWFFLKTILKWRLKRMRWIQTWSMNQIKMNIISKQGEFWTRGAMGERGRKELCGKGQCGGGEM